MSVFASNKFGAFSREIRKRNLDNHFIYTTINKEKEKVTCFPYISFPVAKKIVYRPEWGTRSQTLYPTEYIYYYDTVSYLSDCTDAIVAFDIARIIICVSGYGDWSTMWFVQFAIGGIALLKCFDFDWQRLFKSWLRIAGRLNAANISFVCISNRNWRVSVGNLCQLDRKVIVWKKLLTDWNCRGFFLNEYIEYIFWVYMNSFDGMNIFELLIYHIKEKVSKLLKWELKINKINRKISN